MRPFIIDSTMIDQIEKLVEYAEAHPYSMDMLLDKNAPIPGDFPEYVVDLPFGYRIVFTIEDQPSGKVRHLSMSVDAENKLPNPEVVRVIMTAIGFENDIDGCLVRVEDIGPSRQAINILELIKK